MRQLQNLISFVLILFLGVNYGYSQSENQNVSVQGLNEVLKKKDSNIELLDVRTEQEYAKSYIHGAKNINWLSSDFAEEVGALDKSKTYYVYCFSGARSAQATAKMLEMGFTNVYNVNGGIRDWTEAGYDIKDD